MVKRLLSIVAIVAMTVLSASAMKSVHLEAKDKWAAFGLVKEIPFTFDKYVAYEIEVANVEGAFNILVESAETHKTNPSWAPDTEIDESDAIFYDNPVTDGVIANELKERMAEKGCTAGIRNISVQACDGATNKIDIIAVYLITPEGEKVQQELGVDAWGGDGYTATEIKGDTPDTPEEPDTHGKFIKVTAEPKAAQDWDTQFFFTIGEANALAVGDEWEISFDYKADAPKGQDMAQWHKAPGEYQWWKGVPWAASTKWQTASASGVADDKLNNEGGPDNCNGCYTIAFNLSVENAAMVYYFDNISFKVNGVEKIVNGDIEGDDFSCFLVKEYPGTEITVVSESNIAGINNVKVDNAAVDGRIYNVMGVQVDENYKGLVIRNGKKYIQK